MNNLYTQSFDLAASNSTPSLFLYCILQSSGMIFKINRSSFILYHDLWRYKNKLSHFDLQHTQLMTDQLNNHDRLLPGHDCSMFGSAAGALVLCTAWSSCKTYISKSTKHDIIVLSNQIAGRICVIIALLNLGSISWSWLQSQVDDGLYS